MRWILFALLWLTVPFALSNGNGTAAEDRQQALRSLLARARVAQSGGNFEAAAALYRHAVELDPSIPELWANLGLMDHELGNSQEAIESFKRALHLKPSLFVPQLFLGIEYIKQRNAAAAIPYLENAERLNPNDLQSALSLGSAFAMLDDGDRAAGAYRRAIRLAPRNGNAWLGLGTAYLQQVENDARRMTSTYRHSPYTSLRSAETLAQEGALPQAENAFKAAISSPSVLPCAHAEFGIVLLELKRPSEAREQFDVERRTHTGCGLAAIGLAIMAVAEGQTDAGLKGLVSAAGRDARFVRANLWKFRNVLSADQVQQLIAAARAKQGADSIGPGIASLIENSLGRDTRGSDSNGDQNGALADAQGAAPASAQGFYEAGNYHACDQALRPALRALSASQQLLLASCSFSIGDFQTASAVAAHLKADPATTVQGLYWESKADEILAVDALTRAGEIEPDSPQMHVLIGDAFRQRRRWSEAEAEYRKAVHLDPKSRAARLSLAIVLFTELKTDEALAIDKSLLEEIPSDPEANLLAAEILVQKHEFQNAEPFLSGCKDLKIDLVPRCHVLLGQVYAAAGRDSDAISQYRLGLASDQDGSVHYQLARLYQKAGDKTSAQEQIRISRQIRERWDEQAHIDLGQAANTE